MVASEIAEIVAYATPYVTAAAGTYSGAVLSRSNDRKTNAMIDVGVRFLERIFGRREAGASVPEEVIDLGKDPDDKAALGAVCYKIRKALDQDSAMLEDVRSILPEPPASTVTQTVQAGRDAYVSGRDMTVNRPAD